MRKVLSFCLVNILFFCGCSKPDQKDYIEKKYNAISKIPTFNGDSISIQELMNQKGLKGGRSLQS